MIRRPTSLRAYYLGSWWAVLSLAFVLVWQSQLVAPSLLIFWFGAVLWIRELLPNRITRGHQAPGLLWLLALVVLVAASIEAYGPKQDWVRALVILLLALVPLFLYRRQKSFGNWMAFLVLSLLALISVVVRNTIFPYVLFVLYLAVVLFNLNATHLWELAGSARAAVLRLPPRFFFQFGHSLIIGGVIATLIFLIFPRTRSLNNPFGWREQGVDVGYSGQVSLRNQSDLKPSSQLALVVDSADKNFLAQKAEHLYYRGNVLDQFNGRTWSVMSPASTVYTPMTDLRFWRQVRFPARTVKIYREPHSVRNVVYPGMLVQINAPESLLDGLFYDQAGNLLRGNSERMRYAYDVTFVEPLLPDGLGEVPQTRYQNLPRALTHLTEVPSELLETLQRWERTWVRALPRDASLGLTLETIKNEFNRNFKSSLQHSFAEGQAIDRFLLHERQGHCEFFATAAALYLRSRGIPARLALGFRGGKFNPIAQTFEVRESEAHAWVEVFHPENGWFSFDPTPAAMLPEMSRAEAYWLFYTGAVKFWLNRYLVNYNRSSQMELFRQFSFRRSSEPTRKSFWQWDDKALGGLGAAFAVGVFLWFWRRRSRVREERLPSYYRAFERRLRRLGVERSASESYQRFHERLLTLGWDEKTVSRIDQALEQDLYSRHPLSSTEAHGLLTWVRGLSHPKFR